MFTNYDGSGNGFGDTLIKSEYENEDISVYSSIYGSDENTVKIIITNHSLHDEAPVEISLASEEKYQTAEVYSLYGDSPEIKAMPAVEDIAENTFSYNLPPLSVTEFAVNRPVENVPQQETEKAGTQKKKAIIPVAAAVCAAAVAASAAVFVLKKRKK